jgi:hypothetical protein
VAELGTSKSGGTISQLGCSTSVACHGNPRKQQQPLLLLVASWDLFPLLTSAFISSTIFGSKRRTVCFMGQVKKNFKDTMVGTNILIGSLFAVDVARLLQWRFLQCRQTFRGEQVVRLTHSSRQRRQSCFMLIRDTQQVMGTFKALAGIPNSCPTPAPRFMKKQGIYRRPTNRLVSFREIP